MGNLLALFLFGLVQSCTCAMEGWDVSLLLGVIGLQSRTAGQRRFTCFLTSSLFGFGAEGAFGTPADLD